MKKNPFLSVVILGLLGLTVSALGWAGAQQDAQPAPAQSEPPKNLTPTIKVKDGHQETPLIPGTKYHVHDGERPQPVVVTPGATFSDKAPPPSDAIVLFDGKDLSKWQKSNGQPAHWTVQDGFVQSGKGGGIRTKDKFPDFQLHVEWSAPTVVKGNGQGRGNSGILINGAYEVQVLDSFNNATYPDGQAGAMYGQAPPLANASRPPGEWQTYDIIFESALWNDKGEVTKKANITVIHNGVVLHHKHDYFGFTDGIGGVPHPSLGAYKKPHPPEVFIELQDHSNPVRFRNIWIRPLGTYDRVDATPAPARPTETLPDAKP